jgi:3-oxoacyl-[acyl-carrier protein] reductase
MKSALILGGTKGIGRAISLALIEKDYDVTVIYGHDHNAARELFLNTIKKGNLRAVQADLSTANGYNKFILDQTQRWDCVVFNVGITDSTPFGEISYDFIHKVMDTNVILPFLALQQISNQINDNGRIIFISSILGIYPHARSIFYGVSKAAINALVKNMVKYLSRGITINAIAPGFCDTDWHNSKSPERIEFIKNKIALHRFATPEEVASLCMEVINNQYLNGQILEISGGYSYE